MSDNGEPHVPTQLAGRYTLDRELGSGGAGSVWRAHDTLLDRDVAIKLLHRYLEDDETVARFRREATAAAALTHPNVAVTYDIGEDDGHDFLVMELVDGPTLADLLEDGPLPPELVAAIGHEVANALAEAHGRGLVHRDVKPANVLIGTEGVAKVVDFGIAKAVDEARTRLTSPGKIVGTAAYLAPEQLQDREVGPHTDVYSLGLVLFESLTGRKPFEGDTVTAVAASRLTRDPDPPSQLRPDVPPALDEVVVRATRREPDARYADGGALARALRPQVPPDARRRLADLVRGHQQEQAHPPRQRGGVDTTRVLTDVAEPPAATVPVGPRDEDRTDPGARAVPEARTVPAAEPAEPADAGADDRDDGAGRTWTGRLASVGLAVVVLAALAAVLVGRGDGDGGGSADGDGGGARLLPVAAAQDFDPQGGDGEHGEDVGKAVDANPNTSWQSQRYESAALGGLKSGVGIWFDLGGAQELARVEVDLATPGASLELLAVDAGPPGDRSGWGTPVATVQDAPSTVELDTGGTAARYWLLWFTSLPRDRGGYRVRVSEVRFVGR